LTSATQGNSYKLLTKLSIKLVWKKMLKDLNLGSQNVKHVPANKIHLHFCALLQKKRKIFILNIKINRSVDILLQRDDSCI